MSILIEVPLEGKDTDIHKYKKLDPKNFKSILEVSKKLHHQTIIHINSTPLGGGVAEMLKSQVLLERSVGLKSYWLTIRAPQDFYIVTKKIHNLLQGRGGSLSEEEKSLYLSVNHEMGEFLRDFCKEFSHGIVVVHDPQPLLVVNFIPQNFSSILRLHIDLSTPNPLTLDFLSPSIKKYQLLIVSNKDYCSSFQWLEHPKMKIIWPAIDPFTEKNQPMSIEPAVSIMEQFNVNISRPTITQVSRFDSWKDPLGVIQAYYLAKNEIPNLQLIMAGFFLAYDDPEAMEVLEKLTKHAESDPDIHLFSDIKRLQDISNDSFINALYTASTVIIQKSIREGFGLTMTEAMWKGKAVVAGRTSGSLIQINNNKNGILISSTEEAAHAIVRLVKSKELRDKLGEAAHESVKNHFLLSRFLLDNLKLYASLPKKSA